MATCISTNRWYISILRFLMLQLYISFGSIYVETMPCSCWGTKSTRLGLKVLALSSWFCHQRHSWRCHKKYFLSINTTGDVLWNAYILYLPLLSVFRHWPLLKFQIFKQPSFPPVMSLQTQKHAVVRWSCVTIHVMMPLHLLYLLPLWSKVMQVMTDESGAPPNSKTCRPESKSQTFTTWKQSHIDTADICHGHVPVLI